ncbi:MAG: tetratricopeptide repeat protein [Ilumatobacteraceae bacterium]
MAPRRFEAEEREPRNEAERRRRAVRARGAGTARKDLEPTRVEREPEQWIDEGPTVREAAVEATERATRAKTRREPTGELDPTVKATVEETLEPRRAARLSERLLQAQVALEADRFTDARRIARSLMKEMGHVAAVHEVLGLSSYRLGKWREAAAALEIARSLRGRVEDLPVLADCYRALRRWAKVDEIWQEIREVSPAHDIMAEGRIVAAGSLAERGDLRGAIAMMEKTAAIPRRVRPFHLKQWYVLADLYDRAGNVPKAREMFRRVAVHDRDYADVADRLASL